MEWGNILGLFAGDGRAREQTETRELWDLAQQAWRASPPGKCDYTDIIRYLVRPLWEDRDPLPPSSIIIELCVAMHDLLLEERFCPIEPDWPAIDGNMEIGVRFRALARKRRQWSAEYDRRIGIVVREFGGAFVDMLDALPPTCFEESAGDELFEIPLVEALHEPALIITKLIWAAYDPEGMRLGLHEHLRATYARNMLVASGFSPDADAVALQHKLVFPTGHRDQTPSTLVATYLAGTPFGKLLESPVPFRLPPEARFEHAHIIGGTGHGKTQLLQRMIHADLVAAQTERRSVVVIDSQGDLINKLIRLSLFDPEAPDSLADRLIVIDPADVEFPAALNLFDAHLDRMRSYLPVDRERVLNGVIELYEVFFGAMLGAELTQKQGVIFRYLARLMLTIEGATIHTLMQLMEDGHAFKPQMAKLEGSARHFFATEFFHPSFAATKKQILKRLWGVLSTPAFERMFAQKANKLDLFKAMNDGKIVLISTAKDLLKTEGSALFGRFFIALLAQAALERSTLSAERRTPTYVYVDEAQEYFDDSIETILTQARKYRVGITLAHQTLDQLSPRLRSAILANTSLKCVGGVSSKDAHALAGELHTTPDFIESMRRQPKRTEFAIWLKQTTPRAIRMAVPLGFLERQPILSAEAFETLIDGNREHYCGRLEDVLAFEVGTSLTRETKFAEAAAPASSQPAIDGKALSEGYERPPAREEDHPVSLPIAEARPKAGPQRGKGGTQHRYVQHLVKGLAEAHGFRAIIEEQVAGGFVDVGLHRSDVSIACEISVTSTAQYEGQNLAKCLAAGFDEVFVIAVDQRRLRIVERAVGDLLEQADKARVRFITPDQVEAELNSFGPTTEETIVRGYKVRTSRTPTAFSDAADRRAALTRAVVRSMRS